MSITFSEEFGSPKLRAKLHLFLVFARATRACLPTLHRCAEDRFLLVLQDVADAVVEEVSDLDEGSTVKEIFEKISALRRIKRLRPADRMDFLSALAASLEPDLANGVVERDYPGAANRQAVRKLEQLGLHVAERDKRHRLLTVPVRPLRLLYDEDGRQACAISSTAGPVMWAFQPTRFGFYSAVLLDLILAHEYLCHLLPANQWLEKDVREVWLHSCIQYGIRNCWFAEGEARSVYLGWLQFEQEYVANFFPKGWGSRGSTGMDQFTTRLCGHALFWQITFTVLAAQDGRPTAVEISESLDRLSRFRDAFLRDLNGRILWSVKDLVLLSRTEDPKRRGVSIAQDIFP
ncbi:MAG TPA: hypothetical protein VKV02_07635 [Acidobacteriaceae bacterium]|nr:hypothetical protein [Acidobacteriaceae bacterium]